MTKLNIGDRVLVERAWEDDAGNYHDEEAEVIRIDKDSRLGLSFFNVNDDVARFLKGSEFFVDDVEKV